ncbi:MAG: ATP-binding protein [Deltaproteobacteria bacterium]|nr:ATP-binding protein [Deltaproteobacteria bacterium]MBW2141194.1 ATP-binding protein [Deltaproteobacteria bacterium]MBW2324492.1 ATP-binding protein [Deltaproteobacteria bacterium]
MMRHEMIVSKPKTFKFENEKEITKMRDMASEMAFETGFDKIDCAQVALAVSEIAGNALKFAGKGVITIRLAHNNKGLEIFVQDDGQGFKSVKKAMEEGYSSMAGSFGIGLNAAKRAMDELIIKSKAGQGATVIMRKYLPIPEEEIEYGVISLNDERYPVNGDAYVVKEFKGDKALLAVIDGTGNGFNANKAATFVKDIIEQNYKSDLTAIVTKSHKNLRKAFDISSITSCVMSLLLLKPRSLEYVGVGDTTVHVMGAPQEMHLLSQPGLVGDIRPPDLKSRRYRCGRKIIIIMCSDGIKPHFTEKKLPLEQNAQRIANYIMENYRRQYGDATVLVAKRKR